MSYDILHGDIKPSVFVDVVLALVRRDGRSLHDILFDTRVVLDVSVRSSAADEQTQPAA